MLKCVLDSVSYSLRVRLLQPFVAVATYKVKCCVRKRFRNLSFRVDREGGKGSLATGVEINVFRSRGVALS